jgi:hypothetical protein
MSQRRPGLFNAQLYTEFVIKPRTVPEIIWQARGKQTEGVKAEHL